MTMRSQFVAILLLAVCTAASRAADKPNAGTESAGTFIHRQVPDDFPTSITTIVEGRWAGKVNGGIPTVAEVVAKEGRAALAQRIGKSDRYLWFTSVAKEELGREFRVESRPAKSGNGVTIREVAGGYEFRDGARTVLRYQRESKSLEGKSPRANYVHPLYGLDGDELTQDFPADHIHHRGIFWAWHQIYVGDKSAGDAWVNDGIQSDVKDVNIAGQGPVFATLRVLVDWTSSKITDEAGQPQVVVNETTLIRLYRAKDQFQYVDFEIRLSPRFDNVRIGGAENARGYSGFTARLRPPQKMVIADENGVQSKDAVGSKSRWVDVSGRFGEAPDTSGVTILSHDTLPEFPPKWLLRHYGMQNVVYPGQHPVKLVKNKPLVLRHRLLLHRGTLNKPAIDAHQKAYEHQPY